MPAPIRPKGSKVHKVSANKRVAEDVCIRCGARRFWKGAWQLNGLPQPFCVEQEGVKD